MTWLELEQRFRDLAPGLQWTRLDTQTGSAGEIYRLAGSQRGHVERQFELLAAIAGKKLAGVKYNSEALEGAPNDLVRWYRYLCLGANGRFFEQGPIAREQNEDGSHRGHIFLGSVASPAEVSATQCLELHAMDDRERPTTPTSITLSGPHSRINVNSVDHSTNISSGDHVHLFNEVRTAIEKQLDGEQRERLLARLNALEEAVHKPSFGERFADFLADAKEVMHIVGPYVTALSMLIPS